MSPLRLTIDGRTFRDSNNRQVTLRGINVAGDAKFPARPDLPSHIPDKFYDGDNVSFVGRPFTLEEADIHLARLRHWGFNTIRYIFTWEAIESAGPGKYDEEWIKFTISVLQLAKEYGFYIFMDPHQDVWSRFSGGSGAPMWTLYACGLNLEAFCATEAALVHNTYPDPEKFPKMVWSTNYYRLACQVIFTLFFAGKDFAPKAVIDGKNIQDYLQEHFIAACQHLAKRVHEAGDLADEVVIGWENMNEPNRGLVGIQDITVVPSEQKLQLGTSPTAWQAMLLGSGRACDVDTWAFGGMGPYKSGTALVDPEGVIAWLPTDYDDTRYGWKRDPGWKLGECLWAQHGVWDPSTDMLLKKDYFGAVPSTGKKLDYGVFVNTYFMDHYRAYSSAIREVHPEAIMFCQPPVLEIPPVLKGTADDDKRMVYAPHFYDGLTLMTKKWNRIWNVDVLGILRGRYLSPTFAIKLGETAIRNCLRDQISAIRQEGIDNMGEHPCMLTEFGIPYDMDDKYAYKTGDYSSQLSAMDANHFAVEGSGIDGFTLWVYMSQNNHRWGDLWNGEDLSIFSLDDRPLPNYFNLDNKSTTSLSNSPDTPPLNPRSFNPSPPSYSQRQSTELSSISRSNLKATLSNASISAAPPSDTPAHLATPGFRAAEAFVRPSPIETAGTIIKHGFDLRNCIFTLSLTAPTPTQEATPTEIFLPDFHFPRGETAVDVSGGKWTISSGDVGGGVDMQKLRWWHGEGEQDIKITGVKRRAAMAVGGEEDGYLDQCQQSTCALM
ncbi:endo-1,4-beta-glucanase [Glutinoglossum americanum]|uniref:Endo-1,4-beta-glucanase n=1 Tax=Glutinoglossum americanum TaxID=1670608 RepID=A0A9P8L4J6_9PEZI|nr:endo-1,4-beta-glucanase [Glutinoglossum americanum]